jgi:hypothetical protein
LDVEWLRGLMIDVRNKRVLVAVAARRFPDKAKELLALARVLDFHRDVTSLCLRKVLDQGVSAPPPSPSK